MFSFFLTAVFIRGVLLLIDCQPRFYLGDSESYLATRIGGWIPNDRSWLYGLAVNGYLFITHSITSLILLQSLLTSATLAVLAALCVRLGARKTIGWGVLLLASVEPIYLYCDRAVLTDAPGASILFLGLATVMVMLQRPSMVAPAWATVLLFLALALRTAYAPLVAFAGLSPLALVGLQLFFGRGVDNRSLILSRLRPALLLAIGVSCGIVGYARLTGHLTGAPASVNPRSGYFLLGNLAPVLAPIDFQGLGIEDPDLLLQSSQVRERSLRNAQNFAPDGLDLRLEQQLGDWREVSRVGNIIARRAVIRDPVGFAKIVAESAWDYLTIGAWTAGRPTDMGIDRHLPDQMTAALSSAVWEGIRSDLPTRNSPILRWALVNVWALPVTCWIAILFPVAALVLRSRIWSGARLAVTFAAASTLLYLATIFAFTAEVAARFLLPLEPSILLLGAVVLEYHLRRHESRRRATSRAPEEQVRIPAIASTR